MAPARKSRTNKRYTSATSYSPEKDVGNSNKIRQRGVISFSPDKDAGNSNKSTQRKKKLSDKLGPQWSKEDLERFYDAYRKNGRDWKRVAAAVRNRSAEMVEALYSMNRAYLSLPEGTASVIGLIAMMTDHYNVLEGSDSDYENNDASGLSTKPQKQKRGKDQLNTSRNILQSYSSPSADGCLSSWLKRKRSDVAQPRVVGKRTPRVPVQHLQRKDYMETCVSPFKKSRKPVKDNEDEVAHAALVLAEASQRVGSPQVSTPYKRQEHLAPSPARSWDRLVHQQTEKANSRHRDASGDDDWLEGSVGSRGAESGEYTKDSSSILEGVGTVEVHQAGRKFYRKNEKVEDDDGGEACSGTEGLNVSSAKGKHEVGISNTRTEKISPQIQRKRSKKLFFGDESSAFDALQTLANLSVMQPPCAMESDSSVHLKPEVILDNEDKFNAPEATSSSQVRSRNKVIGGKLKVSQEISGNEYTISKKSKLGRDSAVESNSASTMEGQPCSDTKLWKRKRKPFLSKKSGAEAHGDSPLSEAAKTEVNLEEESKPLFKGKRSSQTFTPSKQWKSLRSSEGSLNGDPRRAGPRTDLLVATTQLPASSQVNIPPKRNSRRKMNLPQAFYPSEMKSFENVKQKITRHSSSIKEKLFSCLSSCLVRRWCTFEWFYSAIDYPWFAKREFEEYLNHVGLGHIPRLTRVEWGVIRSSLGKPRRFSEHFLREERDKLKQYRESVRNHYAELRTGLREGLPTDLAKPLAVGQRVIALHPRTREVHDGSVLTVDHDKCRIQFDRPDIGVEFVMDVDCMPLNPLDNMPEVLRMQKSSTYKCSLLSKDPQMNGNLNFGGPTAFVSSGHADKAQTPMNTIEMQGNGENTHTISQLKAAAINIVNARPGAYDNYFAPNNQSREADIRVISELTRALDKKETLLMELKKTNDEVSENQNNGDYSLRASEPFMKHYATVLVQLKEASGQVSSALHGLRQRNNYPGNVTFPWLKVPPSSGAHGGPPGLFETFPASQESSSIVVEILKGSKLKAQAMVDAAIKAFSSSNKGEDAYAKIREALESIDNNKLMTSESKALTNKPHEQVSENLVHQTQPISCKTEPGSTIDQTVPRMHVDPNKMEMQIPAEVITSCVATLLMIQTCTERQYPPGDVAQILDSAATSLHPCCPQNLQIYREIQTYMGRIKTQILALVPT